jgi:hypothetical protein
VPAIAPVAAFSAMPDGKLPPLTENVIGAVPVATIVAPGAAVPATAGGNAVAGPVIAGGVGGGGGGAAPPPELLPEPPPPPPPQAVSVNAREIATPHAATHPLHLEFRFIAGTPLPLDRATYAARCFAGIA